MMAIEPRVYIIDISGFYFEKYMLGYLRQIMINIPVVTRWLQVTGIMTDQNSKGMNPPGAFFWEIKGYKHTDEHRHYERQ